MGIRMIDFITLGWLNRAVQRLDNESLALAFALFPIRTRLTVLFWIAVGTLVVCGIMSNIWQICAMLFSHPSDHLLAITLKLLTLPFGTLSAIAGWIGNLA
jgi:hypothetical protein